MNTLLQTRAELLNRLPFRDDNDWVLALKFILAIESEDFEICQLIKREVDRRLTNGLLDECLMMGFRGV